ncbi:MAG: sulfatase-like hydrolase/transferase [Planctomycetes bacterium]|nr:sulfatase-like hydrolase/transferase [Planctomycetota bacterium]
MMRLLCLVTLTFTLPLAAQNAPTETGPAPHRPPNVVYVMADELGYYELSCLGNPNLETPNIDRMAEQGMRFTQCLAGSAVCAPTRCCFLTGKHSGHTSVRSNGGGTPMRDDEVTIATLLKERGYTTGGFGKWGCGGRGSTGVPEQHGFDTFVGYYDQVHAHSYFPAYLIENSDELPLEGNTGGRSGQTYSHYVIVERAFDFIRTNKDQPFFCYMPITPPHGLFDIPDDDPAWARFKDRPWSMDARRYAAMVAMVDRQVGELFALLKELGLDDDTIVLFSGDNGGADYFASEQQPRGVHGANVDPMTGVEFRGHKGQLYEGGLRIPMVARWPGHIAPGTVTDHLCYFPDLLPTLTELCGAATPDDVDGLSFAPTLIGGDWQRQHEYLYWEIGGQTAVRCGDWKLIRTGPKQAWQLYDLATDVSEQHDVAAQQADVVARLAAMAAAAHQPCVEGTFADRGLHERDRRAKWGEGAPENEPAPRRQRPAQRLQRDAARLPSEGMLPRDGWKVVRVSSESKWNGKLATNAFDGDPRTFWHSEWRDDLAQPPHELVLDLGRRATMRGFRYLARQDNGWNGTVAKCELAIGDDPDAFAAPVSTPTLKQTKEAQSVEFAPTTGRYVRLRVLSEVTGGPWASIAELGLVGQIATDR